MAETETPTKSLMPKATWGPLAAVLVTVGAYFISQIMAYIIVTLYPASKGWSDVQAQEWFEGSTIAQSFQMVLFAAIMLALLATFLKIKKGTRRMIGLVKPQWRDIAYALAAYGVYFIGYIVIVTIAVQFLPSLDTDQKQQIGFEQAYGFWQLFLVFISLVILPPIAEEIAVRGFLYSGLRQKLPVIMSAIVTSVIFAAAHLQFGSNAPLLWVAALDTFLLSFVLIYLRERTGSLWASMGLHAIKNGVAFLALFVFATR
jgi:membrane protease YdiL (CAAX protease family)